MNPAFIVVVAFAAAAAAGDDAMPATAVLAPVLAAVLELAVMARCFTLQTMGKGSHASAHWTMRRAT